MLVRADFDMSELSVSTVQEGDERYTQVLYFPQM